MALADTAKLAVELSLDDKFSPAVDRASTKLTGFGKMVSKIGNDIGHGMRTAAQNIERLGLAAGALALGGGVMAVKWAADFDAQLRTINTIAQTNEAGLQGIGDGIRKLAREGGGDLADLTAGYYDLLSAGVKVSDAQALLNDAWRLGRGALGTTSEGVDVLTTALNSYANSSLYAGRGTAELASVFSDQFAQAVADGKLKLTDIAGSFADTAALAAQAGIGVDQIAAAYGALTAQGVPAAEVTTEFNRAIVELLKPGKDLLTLQEQMGKSYADLAAQNGLVPALEQMRIDAEKAGIPFQDLFGRLEGLKFALQTTGSNYAAFGAEQDRIRNSTGALAAQVGERNKGLAYNFNVLKANIKDAGITLGNAFLPTLATVSGKLTTFLQSHQTDINAFADKLGAGFEKAVTWAERLDWRAIGDSVRNLANFGKSLAEGFLAMPTEAKEMLLGLYGLNKLSGGAVVNVGVDIAKGIAGQFFQRGSSPLNPVFVSGGGIGGAGGGGSILDTLKNNIGGLAALAVPIVAGAAVVGGIWAALNGVKDWITSLGDPRAKPFLDDPKLIFQPNQNTPAASDPAWLKALKGDPYETGPRSGGDSRPGTEASWWKDHPSATPGEQEALLRANLMMPVRPSAPVPQPLQITVNSAVTVNVDGANAITSTNTTNRYTQTAASYYGGSPAPQYSH